MNKLIEQLKQHEGLKLKPYLCSEGKLTIGYGRTLYIKGISEYEAHTLLIDDINEVARKLHDFVFWDELNEARQAVLINMAFNLGYQGLLKFKKTIKHISDQEYEKASVEMLDSKWAVQVGKGKGQRANVLSIQMRTGEWQV